jgi:very-short-patch-repair endonuclease
MPRPPRRPVPLTGKIFLGRAAVASGLLTRDDLRSSAWRPVLHGVYADSRLHLTHEHRCRAVARFVLPPTGSIAGRSAAALYNVLTLPAGEPVEVVVPPNDRIGPAADLRVHIVPLASADVRHRSGVRATSPTRTAWDLAQWLDPVEAVVLLDAMVAAGVLALGDFQGYVDSRAGTRGWRRAQRAAALVDAGAESPPESRLRVRLVLAGLPVPVTQYVIERDGYFVARVDLAWPAHQVAVEYDGLWHGTAEQFHADRRRLNELAASGWIVLHVTAQRLREDFDGFVAGLRAALRGRERR